MMTEEIMIDGGRMAGIKTLKSKLKCLEQENKELKAYKDVNEDFKKAWDELNKKYTEVLKLAKENADSNEYCLQELEKENKELKEENSLLSYNLHLKEQENKELEKLKCKFKEYCTCDTEKYRSALEEILESAKFAQCLPCGSGNLEDCLNCNDDTTNNGQLCMEKRIHEIKTKCVEVL